MTHRTRGAGQSDRHSSEVGIDQHLPISSCVDDIGLLPVAVDAAEGLYGPADAAYQKRSIAISSNRHPSGFGELMPKVLASATADRLLHRAHVCHTSGDSVRLTQAPAGRRVSPLS
ncbi:ATP-binding protein [Nocardioides sp. LS1]|uniref:ATP-binding protein n=1 Tax=Nocardioides sp. LS1 TaxID=1027620 RepID=UPI0027D84A8E|nr:ATP-binding protein [Nocardioides sp. LS1]